MTDEQKQWLKDHPKYSEVKESPWAVQLTYWADKGYLYPNGKFTPDDGNTLFTFNLGFVKRPVYVRPMYVGRECYMV